MSGSHIRTLVALSIAILCTLQWGCSDCSEKTATGDETLTNHGATAGHQPAAGAIHYLERVGLEDIMTASERPLNLGPYMRKTLSDALYGHHRFSRPPPEAKDRCVVQAETSYGLILNDALSPGATRGEARVAMDARLLCLVAETEELYAVELVVGEMIDEETAEGVKAVFETLAREIAEDIADALHGQLLTRHLSDADITAALATSKRVGVLMEAASEAGERKIAACIDHLIPLVKHDKTWVAQRAGAALGLIGEDQPAVLSALASMTEGPDPERHFVAINALGDIGGDRALRYLDTMAIGHPTDAIRALARQTVDRVRGRTR